MISIASLNNPKSTSLNLFCFHWVGGTGGAFKGLATSLEESNIKVYGVSLPGRNGRNAAQIPKSMSDLVDKVISLLDTNAGTWNLKSCPLVFFGHSFGGLLSFELGRRMKIENSINIPPLSTVIVSAIKDPSTISQDNVGGITPVRHLQSDKELLAYLVSIGGLPVGIDIAFLEFALPSVRGDYQIFETYDVNAMRGVAAANTQIDCPIIGLYGTDDFAVPQDKMVDWAVRTTGGFKLLPMQGHHFYLTDTTTKKAFESFLRTELLAVIAEQHEGAERITTQTAQSHSNTATVCHCAQEQVSEKEAGSNDMNKLLTALHDIAVDVK